MPAAGAAGQLTEAHRLAQVRLGVVTVRQMLAVFHILDPDDLDGTFPDWLTAVAPIVQAQRRSSAELAGRYLAVSRALHIGLDTTFAPTIAAPVNLQQLLTSMLVTGPVSIRAGLARQLPVDRTLDIAQGRTSAAAMRHVLNGGRETITSTVKADPRAVGYERVTSGSACDFCSMLADRGAVYGEASADFEAHDGCACGAEPVYR
jgi:hypothetical protein